MKKLFLLMCFSWTGAAWAATADSEFLQNCPIKKGDPLSKVKEFYRISAEPQMADKPTPGGSYSSYHFTEYGVYVFFDAARNVQTLRFDRPFAGKIDGVAIGATKEEVVRLKGEPVKEFQGLPDMSVFQERKKRQQSLIENLPDPAPKELVRKAYAEIDAINALPFVYETAWIFKSSDRGFLRYDFGAFSSKVETILSDRGN
jgi:hypothetical protein